MAGINRLLLILLLGLSSLSLGHHARVGIDQESKVTVQGVIRNFHWGNPHGWIEMEVETEEGEIELWNFEMMPPAYLPDGWTRRTLQVGERVRVTAHPFFDGRPGGIFVSVTLPSGEVLEG